MGLSTSYLDCGASTDALTSKVSPSGATSFKVVGVLPFHAQNVKLLCTSHATLFWVQTWVGVDCNLF
jgi:hypothetical protein